MVSPRKMARVASVVISALMRKTVTLTRVDEPDEQGRGNRPTRIATHSGSPGVIGDPDVAAAMAVTMATNAETEPTERSNWPLISSKVAGQATMPMRAVFWRMLMRFCTVQEVL